MKLFRFTQKIRNWLKGALRREQETQLTRGARTHVVIIDGTMSSLEEGMETNAGQTYRLLCETGTGGTVFYEAGLQLTRWQNAPDILMGRGINRQIRRAYGMLASRYRPGDRIFLFGYSRGAYAVRSLAGVIDRIGLLAPAHANVRNIRQAYRHYEADPESDAAKAFKDQFCQDDVEIEMIGVWDTVKALGIRLPLFSRYSAKQHEFHDHTLSKVVKNGFHALALNERRVAFEPVMWTSREGWDGRLEQVWFRGTHSDVGAQIMGRSDVRPLSNIPLVWMLGKAEDCGLALPEGWQTRFPRNATAPSVGAWAGWAKIFWHRRKRKVGRDPSESLHPTVPQQDRSLSSLFRRLSA